MKRLIEAGIVAAAIGISAACGNGDNSLDNGSTDTSSSIETSGYLLFESPFYPYAMDIPPGWETDWIYDDIIANAYHDFFLLRPPDPGEFVPQIDIWAKVYETPITLEEFKEIDSRKKEEAGYTNLKFPISDISIDGRGTAMIRATDSLGFESLTILFVNGRQRWSLEYTTPLSEFELYRPYVLQAVSSIDITED